MTSLLVTAKHYAKREGASTVRERISTRVAALRMHGARLLQYPAGEPVVARIDFGQWIADCECGGAEAVDPDEPIFYCFSCYNQATEGAPRLVIFPEPAVREEIEQLLMERPVDETRGKDRVDRAFRSRPLIKIEVDGQLLTLSRSWNPDETPKDLAEQNQLIKLHGGKHGV